MVLTTFFFYHQRISQCDVLLDLSLAVKAATLIFICVCGSAISSAKQGKSGFIYNLVRGFKISVLSHANVHAFHENPNCTLNSHLLTLKAHNHKMYVFVIY